MTTRELAEAGTGFASYNYTEAAKLISVNFMHALETGQHTMAMVAGEPGGGKTSLGLEAIRLVQQKVKDAQCLVFEANSMDICDGRGMPRVSDDGKFTEFMPMRSFFPEVPTLIVIDEFPQAEIPVQHAIMQICNSRTVGGKRLPDNVQFMFTGNRKEDGCNVNSISKHSQNRLFWMNIEIKTDEWVRWGLENDIHPAILSCVRVNAGMMKGFDVKDPSPSYCTARSLEYLSRSITAHEAANSGISIESLAVGWIGQSAASMLMTHVRFGDQCMSPEELLADPERAAKADIGPVYMMCQSTIAYCKKRKLTPKIAEAFMKFATALSDKPMTVSCIKDFCSAIPEGRGSKYFTGWITENIELFERIS